MRPKRIALALAAVLLLAPAAALAGKGPVGIDGIFYYVDKKAYDKIISVANIDQFSNQFCFAMRVAYVDTSHSLNRRVVLEARSLGSIAKQTSSKVVGAFPSVDLTLTVRAGPSTNDFLAPIIFTGTVSSFCSLDAQVTNDGEKAKAKLWCDLGPDFGAFAIPAFTPDPFGGADISGEDILDSIAYALAKKTSIKVDTSKGDFGVKQNGVEVLVPDEYMTSLSCDIIED
jgi:hypothetical protein